MILGTATLATAIGLFYAVENWRGSSAWRQCRRELEGQGEKLDFRDFVPAPVPDDRNFAMSPLLKAVVTESGRPGGHTKWNLPDRFCQISATEGAPAQRQAKHPEPPQAPDSRGTNFLDLAAWQAFYHGNTSYPQPAAPQSPAADVLLALSRFDAPLQELAAGAARPDARFPVPYGDADPFSILLPHLGRMKSLAIVLTLRASARLELGQPQAALDDLQLALRLADAVKSEPILISYLVRLAEVNIVVQGIHAGLARHAWSEVQLAELEQLLGRLDFLADYQWIVRSERAWGLAGLDYWRRSGPVDLGGPGGMEHFMWCAEFAHYLPGGWIDQNKATLARLHQRFSLTVVDAQAGRVFPERARTMEQTLGDLPTTPYNVFSKFLLPAIARVALRSAQAQTLVNQARVACALERYRLRHGQYPEPLSELVPPFLSSLPHDLIDGGPLRYQRTANGYALTATGWNPSEDAGHPGANSGRRALTAGDRDQAGDWTWRSP